MASFEHDFLIDTPLVTPEETTPQTPELSLDEEWALYQAEEERRRRRGEAALFGVVRVGDQVKIELEEL